MVTDKFAETARTSAAQTCLHTGPASGSHYERFVARVAISTAAEVKYQVHLCLVARLP
jgi:hypothetical protein